MYIVFPEIQLNFCTICIRLTDTAVNSLTQYVMQVVTAAARFLITADAREGAEALGVNFEKAVFMPWCFV